ncbi:DNA-binding HTH domain-containing protein, TetR-type [Desulfonema limicola]|uniref:DNA-binding HTH domain-containing protein, TetR-type n=1 Tax=Desulfonema limicola TaxID=45656 RepID=A0A975BCN3_9BACT|nr:TetR/AcrR family transcriptional regulator [Desulfonema limicola]QTA82926.1 DNA-binding HTH domain-containing protein, TetR-type [Desulfonema limicola]
MTKKDTILFAGTRLFAEKGFSDTSMAELAEINNIASATIFYHFKNKEELFLAVLKNVKNEIIQSFEEYFKTKKFESGLEMVEGVISFFIYMAGQKEEWFLLLHRHHPYRLAEVNPTCRNHLEEIYNCFTDIFERAIRLGKKDGSIRDISTHKTALIVLSMVDGIIRFKTYQLYNAGALYNDLIDLCRTMLKA